MYLNLHAMKSVLALFPSERNVFLREQASEMYSPTIYFISKLVSEIPGYIIFPSIFCLIVYFPVGLNTNEAARYFTFHSYAILYYIACSGLSLFIGAFVSNK